MVIRRSNSDLLIKAKVSDRVRFIRAFAALVITLAVAYALFSFGMHSGNQLLSEQSDKIKDLESTVLRLITELENANEGSVFSDRQMQIQDEAYKQLNQAYASSERENRYLESRLDFYRSIISPKNGKEGAAIQNLSYVREKDALKFEITLVQSIKHKHQLRGQVTLKVFDAANPDTVIAEWPQQRSQQVAFQYFEHVSGQIVVPNLSENARLVVEFITTDGEIIKRDFAYQSAS